MNNKNSWQIAKLCLAGFVGVAALPASANSSSDNFRMSERGSAIPTVLSNSEQRFYRDLFGAIDRQQWDRVENMLNSRQGGLLHQVARAEYYTHANSPKVSAGQIAGWFNAGTSLPQAAQLSRLGERRGLSGIPALPQTRNFSRQPYASKRIRPKSVKDGTMSSRTRSAILDRIKNDDPYGAQSLLQGVDASLSSAARAEWRQRVAWSFYIENNDQAALSLARTVSQGSGAWVAEGEWVAGLAAWRLNNCAAAADAFARGAQRSTNIELTAASHYWAGRSYMRCRRPGDADEQLRMAARSDETLYGMLAMEQLGIRLPEGEQGAKLSRQDWQNLRNNSNVKVAAGLAQIGRSKLADEVLRHQAKIGSPQEYQALSRFARELGMPATQLWMAHNAPRGTVSERAMRYPVANWQPSNGWRVDPSLAFAHTLQESNFRASVVSPAGARGLMQIMPAAARDHASKLGVRGTASDLSKPEVNLAFGQEHLAMLGDSGATQGKLPKIMAAYNAGLRPISRWNSEINDKNDPLLYMESIPYWETRGYVSIVMRNYWMYQRAEGQDSPARQAMAQGKWPGFPQPQTYRTASRMIERPAPAPVSVSASTSGPVIEKSIAEQMASQPAAQVSTEETQIGG
ncbi:MAG: lytic transglycosylase domain-containing protein [Marinomonas sp.]